MAEYLVKTDKPIRLDEVLHLHGNHHYAVKRLEKHGRLIDADALLEKLEKIVLPDDLTYTIAHGILKQIVEDAQTIVEATE